MASILRAMASFRFSSVFSLPTLTVGCAAASSSSTGPIILQGPHQLAQKSTTTGMALCKTSVSKFCSVILIDI